MPGWSSKLARPVVINGGPVLLSLSDVRAFMLDHLPEWHHRHSWQLTAELLLTAAKDPGEIEVCTQHSLRSANNLASLWAGFQRSIQRGRRTASRSGSPAKRPTTMAMWSSCQTRCRLAARLIDQEVARSCGRQPRTGGTRSMKPGAERFRP